ncbi:MAG TPA: hypothetical protein VHJ20_03075 [Polyangia bacterium]|nr:hypothetical protein [Polyangia bacterium]
MRRSLNLALWAAPLVLAAACKPDLGAPVSVVEGTDPRILAVRGVPAEAPAGTPVTYDILAANVDGRIANPAVAWAECNQRKPPADGNAVGAACLDETLVPVDMTGPTYMAPILSDACKLFGPQPSVDKNNVAIRPSDPDVTGGFYAPIRAELTVGGATSIAFALERITCTLANVPADAAAQFNMLVTPNQNPILTSLTLDPDGSPSALYVRDPKGAAPPPPTTPVTWVGSGATFDLEMAWSADSPESFPVWNVQTLTLDMHREAMSASWYVTAGEFQHDRTGRAETETDLTTRNQWTAPVVTASTNVHLWIVLRDSRGGIDFAETTIEVRP